MSVLAFLQNMWLNNPASFQRNLDRAPNDEHRNQIRRRMQHYALFAGCLTGRRLKAAFGADLCDNIIWEEASPVIADNPKDYHPPDPTHIALILDEIKPDAVLCFTKRGERIIQNLVAAHSPTCPFISSPHPAARGADTVKQLQEASKQLLLVCQKIGGAT